MAALPANQEIDLENPEFQTLRQLISYTRQSVFLTGKAGTGKSTFLRYLRNNIKKKSVVLAPTGIAAVNAGGVTIHSFFRLPFKPFLPDDPDFSTPRRLRDRMRYNRSFIQLLQNIELIIIDEISMVRADTIDFIDIILRTYCRNFREPFAGKQLLLVGDIFQLEPVVTSDCKEILRQYYRNNYFFSARAFAAGNIVPIELKKVYRQDDAGFIALLDRIRTGTPLNSDIALLNSRVLSERSYDLSADNDFTMTLATRRDIVEYINDKHLGSLRTPEHIYEGQLIDDFPESALPTPQKLTLKIDAQVVFIKNDSEHRWVNGTIGKVTECFADSVEVELENGTRHLVEKEIWNNIRYDYDKESGRVIENILGSYIQLPLRLAWALTIHKSQGLTFSKAVIDMGAGAFTSGQTYVALSRCRSLEGLTLRTTLNPRDMTVNPSVLEFSRNYNNPYLINKALDEAHADDCFAGAMEAWKKRKYAIAFDRFTEGLRSCNELSNPVAMRLARLTVAGADRMSDEISDLRKEIDSYKHLLAKLAAEYVELGEECRDDGTDLSASIANFNKAIKLAPDYAPAWLCKGMALAQNQDPDNAIEALLKADSLAPDDYRPPLELGLVYASVGDLHNALDRLLVALGRNDRIPAIHNSLADIYDTLDMDNKAEYHRKIAKKLSRSRKKK